MNANNKPVSKTVKAPSEKADPIKTKEPAQAQTPNRPKHWIKDSHKTKRWTVMSVPNCDLTPIALQILQEHEERVVHQVYSPDSAQAALIRGYNFSPAIFIDGNLLGSLGDLENYYKRNFFSSVNQAIN